MSVAMRHALVEAVESSRDAAVQRSNPQQDAVQHDAGRLA